MPSSRVTWTALATMLAASGCSWSSGSCDTDSLPPSDPCAGRGCCETVEEVVLPDGGVIPVPEGADAGVPTRRRFCGACNG